jgi:L-ribulose-5-phosphate 3-epimerase
MYKKGVITDEISQDFEVAAGLAQKYNLNAVEIRSVFEKGPHELDKNDIKKMKDILAGTDLKVCGISSPFFKCELDDDSAVKENIGILRNCIELAHAFDTKIVRGFAFWRKGSLSENINKIIDRFEEPLKIIGHEDIILALETEPSVYTSNAASVVKILKILNSPMVRGLWDPGNGIYDPAGEVPFPDGYEIIKPYMAHMHLKDARKTGGEIIAVPVGEGDVGYIGHFNKLISDGYDDYVVLETHYRPKQALNEELMALPKGSAFSYLGYEATEECLIKWRSLPGGADQ